MKIETKFNVGQTVWFTGNKYNGNENSLYEGKVESIHLIYDGVRFEKEVCRVYNNIWCYGYYISVPDEYLFATKEEAEAKLKKKEKNNGQI